MYYDIFVEENGLYLGILKIDTRRDDGRNKKIKSRRIDMILNVKLCNRIFNKRINTTEILLKLDKVGAQINRPKYNNIDDKAQGFTSEK